MEANDDGKYVNLMIVHWTYNIYRDVKYSTSYLSQSVPNGESDATAVLHHSRPPSYYWRYHGSNCRGSRYDSRLSVEFPHFGLDHK